MISFGTPLRFLQRSIVSKTYSAVTSTFSVRDILFFGAAFLGTETWLRAFASSV
jgi:hypothetical protein